MHKLLPRNRFFPVVAALAFTASLAPIASAEESVVTGLMNNLFRNTKKVGLDDYKGGRGLLTMQGPSGMYLNPTSGTLPAGDFTSQYCTVSPNNTTNPVKIHGMMVGYGVTDWLELGAIVLNIDKHKSAPAGTPDIWGGGPLVRIRLLKQEGNIPQLSIGGYARLGDIQDYNAFLAVYRNIEISRTGFLRSIGLHAGLRETWLSRRGYPGDATNTPVGYGAIEFELPYYFSLMGEISTYDRDNGPYIPWAAGLQWRYGILNVSVAAVNNGGFKEPSFFWGIGPQLKF